MTRKVLTAGDLEGVADGGEIAIEAGTLVTLLAREEAQRRGITLRVAEGAAKPGEAQGRRIVALGADHGGFELKEQLKGYLKEWGYTALDLGTSSATAVDYPDFAEAVGNAVARGEAWRGARRGAGW